MKSTTSYPHLDQAARLRELALEAGPRTLSIAITSGKGGVGKTNVAVNLAICLAAKGLKVTLVDADMGLANADVLMNLRSRYTLSDVVSGRLRLQEVCVTGPGGIAFVPGASGMDELANLTEFERRRLIAGLQTLEANTDILILDCGAGISRNVISFACAADQVLVVTTPQPTALTDAYATIKVLKRENCRSEVSLFVNMAQSKSEAQAAHQRVVSVAQRFLNYFVADSGYMLHDPCVESAVRRRSPFVICYPRSNATACIAAMAGRLTKSMAIPERRGGFFKRVVGMFVQDVFRDGA